MSTGIDSTSTVLSSVIAGGTATVLASPDHTTQILSVVVQVLSLVILWLKSKKSPNS